MFSSGNLQEELKCQHTFLHGDSAQPSASTAGAGPEVRVQLPQELLEPLCQGLGHGLYRLRMYSHQSGTLVPAISMPLVGSPKVVGGTAKRDAAQPLRKAIIGQRWLCNRFAEQFLPLCIQPVCS